MSTADLHCFHSTQSCVRGPGQRPAQRSPPQQTKVNHGDTETAQQTTSGRGCSHSPQGRSAPPLRTAPPPSTRSPAKERSLRSESPGSRSGSETSAGSRHERRRRAPEEAVVSAKPPSPTGSRTNERRSAPPGKCQQARYCSLSQHLARWTSKTGTSQGVCCIIYSRSHCFPFVHQSIDPPNP